MRVRAQPCLGGGEATAQFGCRQLHQTFLLLQKCGGCCASPGVQGKAQGLQWHRSCKIRDTGTEHSVPFLLCLYGCLKPPQFPAVDLIINLLKKRFALLSSITEGLVAWSHFVLGQSHSSVPALNTALVSVPALVGVPAGADLACVKPPSCCCCPVSSAAAVPSAPGDWDVLLFL